MSIDPLAKSYPWNSVYAFAEGDVIRSIDLDGLEKLIIHLLKDDEGKPVLNMKDVNTAISELQEKYTSLDVNLTIELKVGGSALSNEEFKARDDYHWSDSYLIIGNSSQLDEIDNSAEENGWEEIGANGAGSSARYQFYSHISTDLVTGFENSIQKLVFSIQHEPGHPKFRFHVENTSDYNHTKINGDHNHGTPGHIYGTIMNGGRYPADYNYDNTNYDEYMTRLLQYIHGTMSGKPSKDEIIEQEIPASTTPIIEDSKKLKNEMDSLNEN